MRATRLLNGIDISRTVWELWLPKSVFGEASVHGKHMTEARNPSQIDLRRSYSVEQIPVEPIFMI